MSSSNPSSSRTMCEADKATIGPEVPVCQVAESELRSAFTAIENRLDPKTTENPFEKELLRQALPSLRKNVERIVTVMSDEEYGELLPATLIEETSEDDDDDDDNLEDDDDEDDNSSILDEDTLLDEDALQRARLWRSQVREKALAIAQMRASATQRAIDVTRRQFGNKISGDNDEPIDMETLHNFLSQSMDEFQPMKELDSNLEQLTDCMSSVHMDLPRKTDNFQQTVDAVERHIHQLHNVQSLSQTEQAILSRTNESAEVPNKQSGVGALSSAEEPARLFATFLGGAV